MLVNGHTLVQYLLFKSNIYICFAFHSTPVNRKPQNPKVSELTSSKCQVQVNKDPRFTAEIQNLRDFCVAPARALTSKNMLDFCAFMLMMKPNISPNRII